MWDDTVEDGGHAIRLVCRHNVLSINDAIGDHGQAEKGSSRSGRTAIHDEHAKGSTRKGIWHQHGNQPHHEHVPGQKKQRWDSSKEAACKRDG